MKCYLEILTAFKAFKTRSGNIWHLLRVLFSSAIALDTEILCFEKGVVEKNISKFEVLGCMELWKGVVVYRNPPT